MKQFNELGLSEELLATLTHLGFTEPTEIQEKIIPLALAGKDVIGKSATGSGKTLAFGAPILEHVKHGEGVQALILTPTRELTEQVSRAIDSFAKGKRIHICAIYGGVGIGAQINELPRADIVVGTPGRILDHIARKTINLSRVKFFVLDEADRMLDMGFIRDVERIIERVPRQRQTFLFSATISREIEKISKRHMVNAHEVEAISYVDPSKLDQVYYDVPQNEKFSLLVHLLKNEHSQLVMVFCNTKINADFIAKNLVKNGLDALALHGNLSQNKRTQVLDKFHDSAKFILVCTDVAARGLDIKNVSHVYNYDVPPNSTDYIHRIGRTARAGKEGSAITILSDRDYENFRRVDADKSLNIKRMELPEFPVIFVEKIRRGEGRSFGGHRGGFGMHRREGGNFGRRSNSSNSRFGERRSFGGRRDDRSEGNDSHSDRPPRSRFGERRSRFGSNRRF